MDDDMIVRMAELPLQRLEIEEVDGVAHIRFPAGRADGMASRELYETAISLLDHPPVRMLVDLTEVPFVSSGAMGMLLSIRKKFLQHGAQLHVAVPEAMVRKSFQVANLHVILSLYETPEAARTAFK